jgi:signal transduction histidine kinase
VIGLIIFTTLLRPKVLDFATGMTLCLLGSVIVAAASLPLLVLIRSPFLRIAEQAAPEVMREVVESTQLRAGVRRGISRRLLAAMATPVGFIAMGAALISNAHLRRADEREREESARALARAVLELGPSDIAQAGLTDAIEQARALGFSTTVRTDPDEYRVEYRADGAVTLHTPLETGSARVRLSGSTVNVLSVVSLVIAVCAVLVAMVLAAVLGGLLRHDLHEATAGLRLLGTEAVMRGGSNWMLPARFSVVAELGRAIELLAARFRVFAQAQERAIEARERAARMRGLFLASVSHDLKSPLNAILGFTELTRQSGHLTPGQAESLHLIEQRGQELLMLIETILDAARVEAGQLTLIRDPMSAQELVPAAIEIGKSMGADQQAELVTEITHPTLQVDVDRVRIPRAVGTFIGHAVRTSKGPFLRVRATAESGERLRIEVQVPSSRLSLRQLQAALDPARLPGATEHRGLALGLSLARSVVELHGGSVRVEQIGLEDLAFIITLPLLK